MATKSDSGTTLYLSAAAGAHPGRVRPLNEDAVMALVRPSEQGAPLGLLAVADGMGGHQAGEVASRLALDTLQDRLSLFFQDSAPPQPDTALDPTRDTLPGVTSYLEEQLEQAIIEANKAIYDYAHQHPEEAGNLGCTLTCVLIQSEVAVIANVGDSRTYLLRDGQLQQITEDHSYVGQLVQTGQINPEEIYDHPQRNVVTRALGSQPEVEADLWSYALQSGDRLLLCSDGLWEMVRDQSQIARILGEAGDAAAAVAELIALANAEGGADNIGIVVAELSRE